MPRHREFDPDDVLRVAVDLFWEKGYKGSSVAEIVKRSGVAKYGIYSSLGGKDEIFWKVLKQYSLDRAKDLQLPLRRKGASIREIFEFFEGIAELTTGDIKTPGCLSVKVGLELGSHDTKVSDFVAKFFEDIARLFEVCLKTARKNGELDESLNIPVLATYIATELRTVLMLAGSGHSCNDLKNHLKFALRALR